MLFFLFLFRKTACKRKQGIRGDTLLFAWDDIIWRYQVLMELRSYTSPLEEVSCAEMVRSPKIEPRIVL